MRYLIILLLVATIFLVGCGNPYKEGVATQNSFKDVVREIYTSENIASGATYCVFANADVKNHQYDFIGIAPSNICTSIATLKVSNTCDITPEETLEAQQQFGTLYIKQCGPNKFQIYDKESNMTKGYNYEI